MEMVTGMKTRKMTLPTKWHPIGRKTAKKVEIPKLWNYFVAALKNYRHLPAYKQTASPGR
jgi:hypothetical protein